MTLGEALKKQDSLQEYKVMMITKNYNIVAISKENSSHYLYKEINNFYAEIINKNDSFISRIVYIIK